MIIETERLFLRPFKLEDSESIFEYAKDPDVGPNAGWPPHKSVEESRNIVKSILMVPYTYAVCLKEDNRAIGAISLMLGKDGNLDLPPDEAELGYWIGKPFWGKGYITEASRALLDMGFTKMKLSRIWCMHMVENKGSGRVQEKCGFRFHHEEKKYWKVLDEEKTETVNVVEKTDWKN